MPVSSGSSAPEVVIPPGLAAVSVAGTVVAGAFVLASGLSEWFEARRRKRFLEAACNSDLPYLTHYIATHPDTFASVGKSQFRLFPS